MVASAKGDNSAGRAPSTCVGVDGLG